MGVMYMRCNGPFTPVFPSAQQPIPRLIDLDSSASVLNSTIAAHLISI